MEDAGHTADELYCEIPLYGYEGAFYRLKRIDKPVLEKKQGKRIEKTFPKTGSANEKTVDQTGETYARRN